MRVLWIGFVWPEPASSAAGFRTLQLIESLRSEGHEVHFSSPCQLNESYEELKKSGVPASRFEPNDSAFDEFVRSLAPEVVFFDRFMIEEQFGWRVRQQCPQALRVLDTVDLHFLRRARQNAIEGGEPTAAPAQVDTKQLLASDDAIRELAAIYRSDLTLLVSDAELAILRDEYRVPGELLTLSRFFCEPSVAGRSFEERADFVVIGNYRHPPNLDSFRLLQKHLWEKIRSRLAAQGVRAELHVYGAYPIQELMSQDRPATGFRVKGWARDARETLGRYRVNLAPLRFGAGIKGKISEGWAVGTPCVTTSIGAEGMREAGEFGGGIADDWDRFADEAAAHFLDREYWEQARSRATRIFQAQFDAARNSTDFLRGLKVAHSEREARRARNFVGTMLWYQGNRSTEYFSRWIETKRRLKSEQAKSEG